MPVTGPLQMIQAFANTLGASPGADQLGTREDRIRGGPALFRACELAVTGEQNRGPVRMMWFHPYRVMQLQCGTAILGGD